MRWIEYDFVCNAEKGINLHKKVEYNEMNLAIAQQEAVNGEYTITEDDEVIEMQPLAINLGGTNATTAQGALANLGGQSKHATKTCSLTAAGWSNLAQTVSVSGVTASNTVIVAPAPASYAAYVEAGIYCSAQASGKLTFKCTDKPTAALTVNVIILN